MRKYLLILLSVLVQYSCEKRLDVTDYRFTPEMSCLSGDLFPNAETGLLETYKNTPIDFALKVQGNDAEGMEYNLKYDIISGGGEVKAASGSTVLPGNSVNHDFSSGTYNFAFTPTSVGENELRFTLSNGVVTQTASYKLTVREPSYYVTFSNLPDRKFIEQKFSFNIDISEVKESDIDQVATYGKVTKGAGAIYISDQIVAENDKPTLIKIGSSIVSYCAKELNENVVLFEIEDKYGSFQKVPVSFNVEKPEYAVNLIENTKVSPVLNTDYSFKVNIDKKEHPTNTFKASYRFLAGEGTIKINGKAAEAGAVVDALAGDNIFILNAPKIEAIAIEVIITDAFDTQQTTTFETVVGQNALKVDLKQNGDVIKVGSYGIFSAALSEDRYSGKFYGTYRVLTGAGSVETNGEVKAEGTRFELASGNNSFKFKPAAEGATEIELIVSDDNGQEVRNLITYTVNSAELQASATQPNPAGVGTVTNFSLSASEAGHSSNFTVTFAQLSGSGTLKNGSATINPNATFTLQNGTPITLSYIPTVVGDNKLRFAVKDSYNKIKDVDVTVVGNPTDIAASTTVPAAVLVGKASDFTLLLDEPYYTSNFNVKYTLKGGSGTLRNGGVAVPDQSSMTLAKGSHNLSFTPTSSGDNTFTLTVTDSYSKTQNVNVTVVGNAAAIDASASTPAAAIVGKASTFSLMLEEAHYSENFNVKYNLLSGSGTLKNGANEVANGGMMNLAGGTHGLSFIPTTKGKNSLKFVVSDTHGQSQTVTVDVTGNAAALSASASAAPTVTAGNPSAFTVTVDEPYYPGDFSVKYTLSTGAGTFKHNGTVINAGASVSVQKGTGNYSFTPTSAGDNTITLTVTDTYNQSKVLNVNVTGNAAALSASASAAPAVTAGSASSFNLTLNEPGFTGKFTVKGETTAGSGTLKYGSTTITNGGTVSLANGTHGFSFTPGTVGTNTVKFTVSDTHGQSQTINVNITGQAGALSASTTAPAAVTVGSATSFNMTLSEPYYTSNFTVRADITAGSGTIKQGSTTVSNGGSVTLAGGTHGFTFTPTTVGVNTIRYTVSDIHGQSQTVYTNVTGNAAAMSASATTPSDVIAGNASGFNMSFSEPYYTGNYTVRADITGGSGTIRQGSTTISNGGSVALAAGTHGFSFTPAYFGNHSIRLTVTDTYGQSWNTNLTINTIKTLKYQTSMKYENQTYRRDYYAFNKLYIIDLSNDAQSGDEFDVTLSSSFAGTGEPAGSSLFATAVNNSGQNAPYTSAAGVANGQTIRMKKSSSNTLQLYMLDRVAEGSPAVQTSFTIKVKSVKTGEEGTISDVSTSTIRASTTNHYGVSADAPRQSSPINIKNYGF